MSLGNIERRQQQISNFESLSEKEEEGHVSVIYYPLSESTHWGHMKLEVDGKCWGLVDVDCKTEALSGFGTDIPGQHSEKTKSIRRLYEGRESFYRYHVRVSRAQLEALKKNVPNEKSFSCSYAVLDCLTKYAGVQISMPCKVLAASPTFAGLYLESRSLDSEKFYKVEYYRLPSHGAAIFRDVMHVVTVVFLTIFYNKFVSPMLFSVR